ncbi:hypothetical protein [Croceiramulus getboli]|nr:hypothetical protein P8624_13985 [Flavobacteriaceae bacterium YJPT1-3]
MKTSPFKSTERLIIFTTTSYALLLVILGHIKMIYRLPGVAFGITVIAVFAILCLFYFTNERFKEYMRSFSLASLTFIHLWRILAAVLFLQYGAEQLIPSTFAYLAGYGDLIAGLLVPLVLFFKHSKLSFWLFNIVGFIDFLVAVGTGITFTFLDTGTMDTIRLLPLALIPLFGVPISGLTHIVMFDKLRLAKFNA